MPTKIFLEGLLNTNQTSIYPKIFHKFFFDILNKDFREYLHSFEKKPFSLFFYIKNSKFLLEINILKDDLINFILSDIFNFAILEKEFFYIQKEEKISFKILPQKIKIKTFLNLKRFYPWKNYQRIFS